MTYRKIGGLHWLFIGRLRISWSFARKPSNQWGTHRALI